MYAYMPQKRHERKVQSNTSKKTEVELQGSSPYSRSKANTNHDKVRIGTAQTLNATTKVLYKRVWHIFRAEADLRVQPLSRPWACLPE